MFFSCQDSTAKRSSYFSTQRKTASAWEEPADDPSCCVGKALQSSGLQANLVRLIVNSWSGGTCKQYEGAWKKWYLWLYIRSSSPFQCSEVVELKYLFYLFRLMVSHTL